MQMEPRKMIVRVLSAIAIALALAACGTIDTEAQSALLQGGPVTAGHLPQYVNSGTSQAVVQDAGGAGGGATGVNPKEIGLTVRGTGTPPYASQGVGPYGTNFCDYDAPTNNPTGYHYLCLSPNAQGGALIAYGAVGSATASTLRMILNGTAYDFPFALSGILGPPTSVVGDVPLWNNINGTLLSDSGKPAPSGGFVGTTDAQTLTNKTIVWTLSDSLTGAGTNQGTALLVSSAINAFTTVGAGTGTILPTLDPNGNAVSAGSGLRILNGGANSLSVYPESGGSINGGSTNAAVTIYPNDDATFIYRGTGAWYAK